MQIQQLLYFIKIADLGSINKAAEVLLISQPNLSRAIMNLETELNITIFTRNNKGVALTEEGKKLYQYTRTILNQLELIEGIALKEMPKIFSIASYPLISISRLICEVYNRHKNEDIRIQLLECRIQKVIEAVASGEAEIGFLLYNHLQKKDIKRLLQYKNIELNYLGLDTWYANVGPYSPLYDREEVDMAELAQYPIVRMADDYFSNLNAYLEVGGIWLTELKKIQYVSGSAAIITMLKYTDVFRFGPGISKEDFAMHGIRSIPIKNCGVDISIAWIRRRKEILGEIAQEFVQMLHGWVSNMNLCQPLDGE